MQPSVDFGKKLRDALRSRIAAKPYAAISAGGREVRRRRAFDLLIAATALGAELPLYTCNVADFSDLGSVLEVVAVEPSP